MATRLIVTDSSVWTFDFTEMQFRRDPRVEGAEHSFVRYTGTWEDFDVLEETQAYGYPDRIRFTAHGDALPGGYITSTYKPSEQGVVA